jgi:DNA mismatch repair protein MutS2
MKRIFKDIFISKYPSLDLHGYDRDSARAYTNQFILEHYLLKHKDLVIIHGIGSGIIKKEVHNTLKNNKYVLSYKLHTFNLGCTIVKLKD